MRSKSVEFFFGRMQRKPGDHNNRAAWRKSRAEVETVKHIQHREQAANINPSLSLRAGALVRRRVGVAVLLLGLATSWVQTAAAACEHCGVSFDGGISYPMLPDLPGADVVGDARISIYLQARRSVIDVDGCLYELYRPLEVDLGTARAITLSFELPEAEAGTLLLVSSQGMPIEMLDASAGRVEYVMTDESSLEFTIVMPLDPRAPTVPVVITKPIEDDPEPA